MSLAGLNRTYLMVLFRAPILDDPFEGFDVHSVFQLPRGSHGSRMNVRFGFDEEEDGGALPLWSPIQTSIPER